MLLSFRDDKRFIVVPLHAVLDLAMPNIDFAAPVFALGPALRDGHGFLLPLLSDGHWSLLVIQRVDEQLLSTHFDGIPGRNFALACHLVESVSGLLRECVADPKDVALGLQSDANACGAILLAHAACVLGLADVPFEHHVAWATHYLATCSLPVGGPSGAGGLSQIHVSQLKELLASKGVPADKAEERIQAACSKLGVGAVAQALQAKQPWAALKVAASKPSTMFRWVTTAELQEHIELRATQSFGTTVPHAKRKKQAHSSRESHHPLRLDPATLQMAPGSFSSTQGEPLSQLSFAEVQQHATGICFCSPQQVAPFLSNFKSISVDALALLTTTALPPEMTGSLPISAIRYPALYTPTSEAVLVSGSMVQLGDESVQLTPAPIDEVEQIDTCVFKISVYRDQSVIPWERLAEAPMRALMMQHPELTLCKQAGCRQDPSCPRFHPAVEESVEQLFLDLWGRQYQKLGGGKDSPDRAQVYQVFVRVPSSAMAHFQRLSLPGVYCEPRSPDGVGTHPGFAVVWLPNADAGIACYEDLRPCPVDCKSRAQVRHKGKGIRRATGLRGVATGTSVPETKGGCQIPASPFTVWHAAGLSHSDVTAVEMAG